MSKSLAIVILAAGKGTRMKSTLPKVLHPLAHRPMVLHVLDAAYALNPEKVVVITGHGADDVEKTIATTYPNTQCVRQTEQLGTGHAVLQTESILSNFSGNVLILCGDVPLVRADALETFLEKHNANDISVGSAQVADPTGLGRIVRSTDGTFTKVQEHKDCSAEELTITEINTGLYAVAGEHLFPLLHKVDNNNAQEEYYLPDILKIGLTEGLNVNAEDVAQDPAELGGINNRIQLSVAETCLQNRYRDMHMTNGATLQDPATTYFAWDTKIGEDVTIGANTVFGPGVTVGNNVQILPFCHLEGATVDEGCNVGPFARLRPQAHLIQNAKVGNFCEVKKATIGEGAKVNHLTYVGDATIGTGTNIGAGTVFANYDHHKKAKHHSQIGENVAIGANSVIVAPVTVGNDVKIGAGTTVRKDVNPNTLIVDKPDQIVKNSSQAAELKTAEA